MLEKEYELFQEKKEELFKKYPNKYIVIHGSIIDGPYESIETAVDEAQKKYKIGEFLIQQCLIEDQLIQRFHSRVSFA